LSNGACHDLELTDRGEPGDHPRITHEHEIVDYPGDAGPHAFDPGNSFVDREILILQPLKSPHHGKELSTKPFDFALLSSCSIITSSVGTSSWETFDRQKSRLARQNKTSTEADKLPTFPAVINRRIDNEFWIEG
jgi:hypothetical protein